jgi:transcription initiation factor TFIID subunit 15
MGDIPSTDNMVSAVILEPSFGQTLGKNESFTIRVQTQNLDAGSFTNPDTTYYTAPQQLNQNGDIIGHCHVTVQRLDSLQAQSPPDPKTFDFFLGIDDDGNGQGLLSAPVDTGLFPGTYRVCTMIAAMNHQPVSMPVAQRGAQDDCVRFQVVDGAANGTASA